MTPSPESRGPLIGAAYAVAAYLWWGVAPIYFKAVDEVPAMEVLAHRIVWSLALLAIMVAFLKKWPFIRAALRSRRTVFMLAGSTVFISINWGTFIWAVMAERVLEISLGYYINPLVNVVLGVLVLRERLTLRQSLAVALAAVGVLNLALRVDVFPWPSLVVAFSFGLYGLIRKTTHLGSVDGLFLETLLTAPFALAFLVWLAATGQGAFGTSGLETDFLLFLAGVVTMVPLIWFASGARRLNYSTIGLFQYIAPTGQFFLAVFLFGETFTMAHAITFACIWTALALYTADLLQGRRRVRLSSAPAGKAR